MNNRALFNHLQTQNALTGLLAQFGGCAAIFEQSIPIDLSRGWNGPQYPRVVYVIDMTYDPQRDISGILAVDVLCEAENQWQNAEDIESVTRDLIDGYFFTDGDETIRANWDSSNYFTETKEKVSGVTLTFSLLSFPVQRLVHPDTVRLANQYTADRYQSAHMIAYDTKAEEAWKPSDDHPALYWRLVSLNPCTYINDTHTCTWKTAVMRLYVFSDTTADQIATEVRDDLMFRKRLFFDDGGPLMIDEIRVELENDVQRVGQLYLTSTYGILRSTEPFNPLYDISVK